MQIAQLNHASLRTVLDQMSELVYNSDGPSLLARFDSRFLLLLVHLCLWKVHDVETCEKELEIRNVQQRTEKFTLAVATLPMSPTCAD